MKKLKQISIIITIMCVLKVININATPSTQIWVPSTDFQGFKTIHLGIDNFTRIENVDNTRGAGMYDFGLTTGLPTFWKIQSEVGIDYVSMGDPIYDKHPFYFNLKLGIPEDSLFSGFPGLAVGAYNLGLKGGLTNYNILYGVVAKTIPIIGARLSLGYYSGNDKVLTDDKGNVAKGGLFASIDRVIPEISDKLWLCIDYQGGNNYLGSLNFAFSWSFSSNVAVIFGYCIYNDKNTLYNSKDKNVNSFTTQLDINF